MLDAYLGKKDRALADGEITKASYKDYEITCDIIADCLGKSRPLNGVTPGVLEQLRSKLTQGKRKKLGPVSLKRRLTIARMVMKHAKKLGFAIDYEHELRSPSSKLIRKARKSRGEQLYEAGKLRALVEAADPTLGTMILLGINCAFGPQDCFTLPLKALDLDGGWHNYARPKTEVERRCALWPETVEYLCLMGGTKRVFDGAYWDRRKVAAKFYKLCKDSEVRNLGLYLLRRTFETIASTAAVPQAVVDHIIGHSRHDMASVYRQKVFDDQLWKCTDHVRDWYLGSVTLK